MRSIKLGLFLAVIIISTMMAQTKDKNNVNIVGFWQLDSWQPGDGWNDNYRFYKNGEFEFNLNQMVDNLKKVVGLKGKYRIKGNVLYTTVTNYYEMEGGKFMRDTSVFITKSWIYGGGHVVEKEQKNSTEEGISIQFAKEKNHDCFILNGKKYFLVDRDPNYK